MRSPHTQPHLHAALLALSMLMGCESEPGERRTMEEGPSSEEPDDGAAAPEDDADEDGTDAGDGRDGARPDGGLEDAGVAPDASVVADAGVWIDAGAVDAGVVDGGESDAGPPECTNAEASPLCLPYDEVALVADHACALSGGALFCWGANTRGQLGTGDTIDRPRPTQVGSERDHLHVAAGYDHSCAIRGDGELYCWGANTAGALGIGGRTPSGVPVRVATDSDWTQISAGSQHTCGLRGHDLYCWGFQSYGQLGLGPLEAPVETPTRVSALEDVDRVVAGKDHTCALRQGELWCWGANFHGQVSPTRTNQFSPVRVGNRSDWMAVSPGSAFTCAIDASGALHCWGLGYGVTPVLVQDLEHVRSISAAIGYRCVTHDDGSAHCWGENTYGRLGDGTLAARTAPALVASPKPLASIVTGTATSCGLALDGSLLCWGSNQHGLRGTGFAPGRVGEHADYTHVSTSLTHTCATRASGELSCWGGGPGNPGVSWENMHRPRVIIPQGEWRALSVGDHATCAIDAGALYCWGNNERGAVGDGTNTWASTPRRIGDASDWESVSTLTAHTCGIRSGGELWCWGNNYYGQLGDDTITWRNAPTRVAPGGYGAAAAGNSHTCALREGLGYCWGGSSPALGIGFFPEEKHLPVRINSLARFTSIAAGEYSSCAIEESGRLWCWGSNYHRQLGTGRSDDSVQPEPIGELTDWTAITLGARHTCGIHGGALGCWGRNEHGQLGTGDGVDREPPTATLFAEGVQKVSVRADHSCAIVDGALYCWGSNERGQLGHGMGLTPIVLSRD